jgi:phage baseplate assembly protein gpV
MAQRSGVVTGFVKTVDAAQGRIQVSYRAIDDQLESTWAPVATLLSGKQRGALFMPEEGDEVLLAFGDSQFDTPYVLGFLWNGEQVSPDSEPEHRVIVTPGGHQLRFEDKDGDRRVILQSKGGHRITLDDNDGDGAKKLTVQSTAHSMTLDDNPSGPKINIAAGQAGTVSIELDTVPPSVTVTVPTGSLVLDSTGLTVQTMAGITVETPAAATISCTAATIEATAAVSVTSPVITVDSAIATFTGAVQCTALITNAVVSELYNETLGNFI